MCTSHRPRGLRTAVTLLATAGLLATACSPGSSTERVAPMAALPEAIPQALLPYYTQRLTWHSCGPDGFQCATMKAPLDYDEPGKATVDLAVSRKRATDRSGRVGSMLVNPGGPGGSAIQYLQAFAGIGYPKKVRARYDMVAMDPRGVGRSHPVECLPGRAMDAYAATDTTPDTQAERNRLVSAYRDFAAGCRKRSGAILPHVSTVEAAKDMDMFRAVLGDKKLNYVGASYGTFLGATYAGLYPERVGRLVLDGAMDPALSARRMNVDQTAGFETAFKSFAKDCVRREDCPLADEKGTGKRAGTEKEGTRAATGTTTPDEAADNLKAFFRRLDRAPLPTGTHGRPLGEALATTGVIAAMYDESTWAQLRTALTAAIKDKDGFALLALSDSYYERDADGRYANLMAANAAVNCLDLPPAFHDPAGVEKDLPEFRKASPVFGDGLAWASLNCTYWPTPATGTPHRIEARGAAPIVVVGTTRDPATPYKWARSLAGQLSSARLLTYEGDGHTAYGRGSTCIDSAINTYLLTGRPPTQGKRCT
ncbi:alpha/beta hydrolase [Streptomyces sp. NPDC050560]|uniref:alpha/beta hydrolase n=1 Tax=Streptomyces sp. NPDC050560 TaxID=3365630 RepID=UPI0037BC2B55